MVNYNELRKRFKAKDPAVDERRKRTNAAVKRIAREYEMKRAALGLSTPTLRRTPFYYAVVVLVMAMIAIVFVGYKTDRLSLGRKSIPRAQLQARKSIDAVAVALGRYKFHTGEYPGDAEGLAPLAAKVYRKKGWDGPYVNHVVRDPWGNDYVYETRPEGGHPVLYSKGPDGRAGTTDDVLPDQALFDEPFKDTSWTNGWAPYRLRGIVVAPDEETRRRVQEEMKQYDPAPAAAKETKVKEEAK